MRGHTTHTYAEVSKHIGMCAHTQACKHMHVNTCMHIHACIHMHACTQIHAHACMYSVCGAAQVGSLSSQLVYAQRYICILQDAYIYAHVHICTCTHPHGPCTASNCHLARLRAPPPPPTWGEAISVCYLTLAIVATSLGCATPALCPQLLTVVWGRQGPLGPTRLQSSWLQPEPPTHPPTHTHTHITGLKHFGRKQEGQHCPFCGACERD